ncbi:MAG: hypothetical protein ACRCXB_22775 [Aeromonadaceae bacterium]
MAGNKAQFDILFQQSDFDGLIASLQAAPADFNKASDRAASRTMQWMRARVSRELAARLGIPVAKLRTRITQKKYSTSTPYWVLFLGVNHLPIDLTGPIKQNSIGLGHRGGTVRGGFKKDVFSNGEKGWIRKKRARQLGLKLPGLKGEGSGINIDGRFPVLRISHDLEDAATPIFHKYHAQAKRQFMERFEHELAHIMKGKK